MSPRFVKITITLLVVALLLAIAYVVVPKVGKGHKHIDTSGEIVFLSDGDLQGVPHVFVVSSSGGSPRDLTPGPQSCADPSFSPDGSQIAYVSDKSGQQEVYIMGADGSEPHAITIGSAAKTSPQFSPDGKSLAYTAQGTLTSIDLQSDDTTPLLPSPATATTSTASTAVDISHAAVSSYSWSPIPPGSSLQPEIAAVQEEDGVPGVPDEELLTLLPSADSAPVELAPGQNVTFCWSPDGSKIYEAVVGGHDGPQQQQFSAILTFDQSGKISQQPAIAFSSKPAIGPSNPVVSPDGKAIMYSVINNPDLAHNTIEGIYMQALDGQSPPAGVIMGPAKGAQWSPDGNRMLVLIPRQDGLKYDLWARQLNPPSAPVNLTQGLGDVTSAQWSPTIAK